MSSDNTRSLSAGREMLGRYRLLHQLGQGGMGTVYLAEDTKLDRRVAIKVLPPQSVNDAGAVARFQREAKALAKLSHAGIVQVFDSDSAEGRHFLAMEYVEGTSLADVVKENGRISPERAADYLYQAALALGHAHEKGLIHRDLKPANLLLTAQGHIKILDLGLARFLQDQIGDPNVTREGAGLGTPDYAAPEQFRDAHSADVRSDIYSLGCTLYHLLAGQVPFPGSSLAEKCRAHEYHEPAPVEELCPLAPVGLTLAVARMMAKKPDARFQSAAEAAAALAPFVGATSTSSKSFRSTATWYKGQLTVGEFKAPRRHRRRLLFGAAAAGGLAIAFLLWFFFLRNPDTTSGPLAQNGKKDSHVPETKKDPDDPDAKKKPAASKKEPIEQKKDQVAKKPKQKEPLLPMLDDDPMVLTVSQDAKDGGNYRTINDALKKAKPGMTIRVLDNKTYTESVSLNLASQHGGITLEAPRRAVIRNPSAKVLLAIFNVPDVSVRGFRFQGDGENSFVVGVIGRSGGVLLEDLEVESDTGRQITGITLEHLEFPRAKPVIVHACHFRSVTRAIQVSGADAPLTPVPCRHIVLRQNTVAACGGGIVVRGLVSHVHIVGNRFLGATISGIQLATLLEGSRDLLIANNTFLECARPLSVFQDAGKRLKGKNVQIRNNLILDAKGPDMVAIDTGADPKDVKGPGDGKRIQAQWKLDHNWREGKPPTADELRQEGWIAVDPLKDVQKQIIAGLSRQQGQADFLRPAKDSPLAAKGAGQTDPSLPSYVGAMPPEGTEPWDWTRTWQAPPPGLLLTVSKDAKDRGQFRTIRDALKAAKPWTTIRIVDNASYAESLILENPSLHQGLCLEAPKRATLLLTSDASQALVIRNVPRVRVQGLVFQEERATSQTVAFVTVSAHCPGGHLQHLHFQGSKFVKGIVVENVRIAPDEDPLVVHKCRFQVGYDGICLIGPKEASPESPAVRHVLIRDNHILKALRGIHLQGALEDCHITGNLVWRCGQTGLQLVDPVQSCAGIVLANNTMLGRLSP
jgi:serine/threonine protein kinase